MNSTQFAKFKAEQLANQPLTKTVALSQVKILGDSTLEVDGITLSVTSHAMISLAKILNVPIRFSQEISTVYGQTAFQQLIELQKAAKIAAGKGIVITLVADPVLRKVSQITAGNNMLPYEKFFDVFERVMNTHNLEIESANGGPEGITISTRSTSSEFQIGGFKDEVFQPGFTFNNGVKYGTVIDSYLHRLVCTNGMIGRGFNHSIVYNPESQHDFFEKLINMSKIGYVPQGFNDKVKQAIHTKASFAELEQAAKLMVGNSKIGYNQLDKFVPYREIVNKFANKGLDVSKINQKQKENAITNVSVWDVINGITDFASHDYGFEVSSTSQNTMQIVAGNMLAKEFDASNIVTVTL